MNEVQCLEEGGGWWKKKKVSSQGSQKQNYSQII